MTNTRAVALALCVLVLFIGCSGDEPVLPGIPVIRPDENAASGEEDDLQNMSSTQLEILEQNTLLKVQETSTQLQQLKAQTSTLKHEQETITEEFNKLQGAKDWETEEKRKRDNELAQVKKDVEEKQQNINSMQKRVSELKLRIDELKVHLGNLTTLKESTTRKIDAPSLSDVLDARSESWSPMTQKVYRKTRDKVLPALTGVSDATNAYRRRVASSPILEFLASILLYGFFIGGIFVSYRIYTRVRGQFTIARLLFLGDFFCATFWAVMLLCYCFLWRDPLVAIQRRSPSLFFIFQLGALIFYVNFVLLRVLMLASTLSLSALGETLAVVVVGHHYYVRVWQPAMMDTEIHGQFFYVVCYVWLYVALALNRVGEFSPLKQVRGASIPPQMALRIFFSRLWSSKGPDGDLESIPSAMEVSADSHHEN